MVAVGDDEHREHDHGGRSDESEDGVAGRPEAGEREERTEESVEEARESVRNALVQLHEPADRNERAVDREVERERDHETQHDRAEHRERSPELFTDDDRQRFVTTSEDPDDEQRCDQRAGHDHVVLSTEHEEDGEDAAQGLSASSHVVPIVEGEERPREEDEHQERQRGFHPGEQAGQGAERDQDDGAEREERRQAPIAFVVATRGAQSCERVRRDGDQCAHRDEHRLEQGIPTTEHERERDQEALPGQLVAVGGGDAIERRAVPVCQVPGDLEVVVGVVDREVADDGGGPPDDERAGEQQEAERRGGTQLIGGLPQHLVAGTERRTTVTASSLLVLPAFSNAPGATFRAPGGRRALRVHEATTAWHGPLRRWYETRQQTSIIRGSCARSRINSRQSEKGNCTHHKPDCDLGCAPVPTLSGPITASLRGTQHVADGTPFA